MKITFNTCFFYFKTDFSHFLSPFIHIFAAEELKKPMINFTELYDKQIDNLFAFGTKFTSDREMIKDCIQDVFVKLYTKKDELDSIGNIESYLYVSLKNRINDEFRRNTHLCDEDVNENLMKSICDSSETLSFEKKEEEQNRNTKIVGFIKCLSPSERQIINLYYLEQRKYDDICQIMGINYQSVRNLMHRSIIRLRTMAANNGAI